MGIRLTRAESQQRTKQLVVESATKLFLRDGFRATSLEAIAEDAGYTRGAVYSNFANKTEMGIAVVDSLYEDAAQAAIASFEAVAEQGPAAWIDALTDWSERSFGDPAWARLELEVGASSARDGALRAATARRYERLRSLVADLLVGLCQRAGLEPPAQLELLSLGAVSLGMGLGMQRASDRTIPGSAFGELLHSLLPGILTATTSEPLGAER